LGQAPADGGTPLPTFVSPDGGTVPVVADRAAPKVAKVLAPELVPDGGTEATPAPTSLSVYNVNFPAEAALTGASLAFVFMLDAVIKPTLGAAPSCRSVTEEGICDVSDLPQIDRYAVGRHSSEWSLFSDITLGVSLAAPVVYLALESLTLPTKNPWLDFFDDALVVSESMALTAVLGSVIKFAIRRPRPGNYVESTEGGSFDTQLSAPSGHTSMVAAAMTSLTTTVFMRHPTSKVRFVVLGAGLVLSGLTAFARVEGGHHFPTDVITGWLIGTASGFVVPYMHRKQAAVQAAVSYDLRSGTPMVVLSGPAW
jgi:membrane-associated phospholipid phosphatase